MGALKVHDRLNDILGISRSVVSQLDLDRSLAVILRKSLSVAGMKAGSVALYQPDRHTLRIHAHRGFSKRFRPDRDWPVRPGGLTERILRSRRITVVSETTNASYFANPFAVTEGIRSLVCVPLVHRRETVGILYLADFEPRTFADDDLAELEIIASFAAIAVSHARAHREVSRKAVTDGLTGLFNRRHFEEALALELQRAERHGREFALAMVDVDNFKKYNDRHGHQAGDAALAALGTAIRRSLRSIDVGARYGGDEMVIILPETPLEKAYRLFANRIKQDIEAAFRKLPHDGSGIGVTIGIASYPRDGATARDLVRAADRALLDAKKHVRKGTIGCARPVADVA